MNGTQQQERRTAIIELKAHVKHELEALAEGFDAELLEHKQTYEKAITQIQDRIDAYITRIGVKLDEHDEHLTAHATYFLDFFSMTFYGRLRWILTGKLR